MAQQLRFPSPTGPLRVTAEAGKITRLVWSGFETEEDDALETDEAETGEDALLANTAEQLEAYFAGRLKAFDLPLAPQGAHFNQAVWKEMQAIAYGETRTYGEIAAAISEDLLPGLHLPGSSNAGHSHAQAVGQACGANPIPILIPCHRVVAAGGKLGGFSGGRGVETKRWLLIHEGALERELF